MEEAGKPNTPTVIPFGKYKGQPIEVLRADPSYVDWLMGQDWMRNRYASIHTLIVNNFREPTETPEHNALQVRFLDDEFCRGVLLALNWQPVCKPGEFARRLLLRCHPQVIRFQQDIDTATKAVDFVASNVELERRDTGVVPDYLTRELNSPGTAYERLPRIQEQIQDHLDGGPLRRLEEKLSEHESALAAQRNVLSKFVADEIEPLVSKVKTTGHQIKYKRDFEHRGWDIMLEPEVQSLWEKETIPWHELTMLLRYITFRIELKPTLGDDFPAILRQMKGASADHHQLSVLIFDRFTAAGATFEQVKAIFKASNITVLTLAQVEALIGKQIQET